MRKAKNNFSIFAITAIAVGGLAVAGVFAAIAGAIILPFLLMFKKNQTAVPRPEQEKKSNVIEADFQRVDKKDPKE